MSTPADLETDDLQALGFTLPPAHAGAGLGATAAMPGRSNGGRATSVVRVKPETYERTEVSPADASGMTLVRYGMTEEFTGGITGAGVASHVGVFRKDGSATITGVERITGTLAGRRGSFAISCAGYYDVHGIAHGTWTVVAGSGTDELVGLHGHGDFRVAPAVPGGPLAIDSFTYWFDDGNSTTSGESAI
jgi:hypothetical protein